MRLKQWLPALLAALCLLTQGALASETETTYITCGDEIVITGDGAATDGQTVLISKGGRYVLSGVLPVGQVQVKARAASVELVLDGFFAANPEGPALNVKNAKDCSIFLPEESDNCLISGRLEEFGTAEDGSGAALRAECDLSIAGSGALDVYGCINNGISSDGTLILAGGVIGVQAAKEGLKAQNLLLCGADVDISAQNDGVEAELDVTAESGSLSIRAARDGIDAGQNILLSGDAELIIRTDTYAYPAEELAAANGTEEAAEAEEISFKVSMSYYAETDQYYALFFDEKGASVWVEVPFEKKGSQNMYYSLDCPAGFDRFIVYRYVDGQTPRSTEVYDACTKELSLSNSQSTYTVSRIADGSMTGSWSNGNMGGGMGWMSWGNANKRSYSCKGLKAAGNIELSGGSLLVECGDDALHAGGYVWVTGGDSSLSAVDDALHADGYLVIDGGTVDILTAFEGLEGYNVYMNGGSVTADCLDDGTNASLYFVMTGGDLDLTLASGDTDGLDANYAVWMTGGTICVRSGAYGGVAGTVDTGWGGITVNGGHLMAIGATAEVPSRSSELNYAYFSKTLQPGKYILTDAAGTELLSFRVEEKYYGGFICSEYLELENSFRLLMEGELILSWTQTAARQTVR